MKPTRIRRRWNKALIGVSLLLVGISTGGCPHHQVKFEDIGYAIETKKQESSVVLVISPQTEGLVVPVRSFMAGYANSWDVQAGRMLKQIADIEFPQMFSDYRPAIVYAEPESGLSRMTIELTIPHYAFDDFRAVAEIRAVVYRPGRAQVMDKSYREEGDTQGGKMFWGGAFGMKSAIRQSSFEVYKRIFARLRQDLLQLPSASAR